MSNYTPKWIDRDTWQIITATIRRYPKMYVELTDTEDSILNGTVYKEVAGSSGYISDPTAIKGIKLASLYREVSGRKCEAINYCLSQLRPEYYHAVCLRFWGVEKTDDAFAVIREGGELAGLTFESIKSPQNVPDLAGYSMQHTKRIIHSFIVTVGSALGEI